MQSKFKLPLQMIAKFFGFCILLVGAIALVRTTASQAGDFLVFWQGGKHLLQGLTLYSTQRDGGMVFKYPPWIAPFFIPLSFFSPETSKWIWGIINLFCLVWIVRFQHLKLKVNWNVAFAVLGSFWGLWIVHFFDGQIAIPLLALALFCFSDQPAFTHRFSARLFVLVLALSTKIFTLFPLLSLKWSKKSVVPLFWIGILLSALALPALWNEPKHSLPSLVQSWAYAARSAGTLLDVHQLRGRLNPGLPGYSLRLLNVPASNSTADIIASLIFSWVLGLGWIWLSRPLRTQEKWLGWLALTPVVHPLPWWHLFVFTYPLVTYISQRCWVKKEHRFACLISIILIGLSTEKVLGPVGAFLEVNAAKSWGTLLGLWILVRVQSSSFAHPKNKKQIH